MTLLCSTIEPNDITRLYTDFCIHNQTQDIEGRHMLIRQIIDIELANKLLKNKVGLKQDKESDNSNLNNKDNNTRYSIKPFVTISSNDINDRRTDT